MSAKPLILILTACCFFAKAQVAVSYFPFQSVLSISSNTERLLWADYKVETNGFISNMNMELSAKINFRRTDWVNYYIGPGFSFNPAYSFADLSVMNGYLVDIGARIKPLEKYRNAQLVFELSPYVNYELKGGGLRTRLGLSYNFTRKKKDEDSKQLPD